MATFAMSLLFLLFLFLIVYTLVNDYKKKKLSSNIQNVKARLEEFFSRKKLLVVESLLNDSETLKQFKENAASDVSDEEFNNIFKGIIDSNQSFLCALQKQGDVRLKRSLQIAHNIDIDIIEHEARKIENNFINSAMNLDDKLDSAEEHSTEIIESIVNKALFEVNSYYKSKIEDSGKLLLTATNTIQPFDIDLEKLKIENIKYYPEYQQKLNISSDELNSESIFKSIEGIEVYFTRVLKNSIYPNYMSKEFELSYTELNKMLIVDYELPSLESFPKIEKIKYHSDINEFEETYLKDKTRNKLYEDTLYQIVLRTIFELFYQDKQNVIELIVFNGWAEYIDKADGNIKNAYIMSLQVKKDDFMSFQLKYVEPKECFKKFRGVCCRELSNITAIKPIMNINKQDKRFIEAYEVMDNIDEGNNLACMDWKDFENLVREVFEKEFSKDGGEVKITQSSKDGGVDAIAFDPDPIRGGKIVIQAKRYTNVVGVSAVRDLYGTVMNEGATKGILVTTSDYGTDSFEFVKDKPLTLLNGSNLLHLLQKHGHNARIDIKEAKQRLKQDN